MVIINDSGEGLSRMNLPVPFQLARRTHPSFVIVHPFEIVPEADDPMMYLASMVCTRHDFFGPKPPPQEPFSTSARLPFFRRDYSVLDEQPPYVAP